MDNITRRQLLELTKRAQQQGFKGSVMDVFKNPQVLQQRVEVAATPQQQQQGLRGVERQDAPQAMVFPNLPPNTSMNTKGMRFPVDMDMYDQKGHLVHSYKNVPPGIESLPTGPRGATVVERPSFQTGGVKRFAGDPWEYKYDNGKFLTRRIGTDRWLTAKGGALEAIRSKVYDLPATGTQMPDSPAPHQTERQEETPNILVGPPAPPGVRPDPRRVDRPQQEEIITSPQTQTPLPAGTPRRERRELPSPPALNLDLTQQPDNTRVNMSGPSQRSVVIPPLRRIENNPDYEDTRERFRQREDEVLNQLYEEGRQSAEERAANEGNSISNWFSDAFDQLQYYLEREGYVEPATETDLEVVEENTTTTPPSPPTPETPERDYFIAPQTHLTDTDVDYGNAQYKYWGYRYQNSNDSGLDYIPGSRGDARKEYTGVGGVGHFLVESDLTDGYQTDQTKKSIKKHMENGDYVPFYKKLPNGRVNIRYAKGDSEYSDLKEQGYETFANLRLLNLSDIAWDKNARPYHSPAAGEADKYRRQDSSNMFGKGILNVLTKDGKDTWMVYKKAHGKGGKFGRFNGNSVVFIIEAPEGRIIRDFSGTVQSIEDETKRIKREFNIDDSKITLGFYDAGSYSAKPMADTDGVLRSRNWSSFNPDDNSGASLLVPSTFKTGGVSNRYLTGGLKRRAKQSGGVDYRIPNITQTFNEGVPKNTLIQVDPKTGEELAYVQSDYNPAPQPMDYDTLLHRQAFQESSFRDDVVTGKKKSTVGAMGLAQFMPNTVEDMKRIGLVGKDFDPYDTTQAATAQRKYMNWLGQRPYLAKGDSLVQQAKVLGAYNAGPGTIKNILTKAKNDGYDIYNSTDWINHPSMPSETKDYIEKILLKSNPKYEKDYKSVKDKYRDLYFKKTGGYKSLPKY